MGKIEITLEENTYFKICIHDKDNELYYTVSNKYTGTIYYKSKSSKDAYAFYDNESKAYYEAGIDLC